MLKKFNGERLHVPLFLLCWRNMWLCSRFPLTMSNVTRIWDMGRVSIVLKCDTEILRSRTWGWGHGYFMWVYVEAVILEVGHVPTSNLLSRQLAVLITPILICALPQIYLVLNWLFNLSHLTNSNPNCGQAGILGCPMYIRRNSTKLREVAQ